MRENIAKWSKICVKILPKHDKKSPKNPLVRGTPTKMAQVPSGTFLLLISVDTEGVVPNPQKYGKYPHFRHTCRKLSTLPTWWDALSYYIKLTHSWCSFPLRFSGNWTVSKLKLSPNSIIKDFRHFLVL